MACSESSSSTSGPSSYDHRASSSEDVGESSGERSSSGIRLIAKKNTTSHVWTYFGFVPGPSGKPLNLDIPVCTICFRDVPAKWGNTSNLLSHLEIKHPTEYTEVKSLQSATASSSRTTRSSSKKGQQTLQQCIDRTKKYSTSSSEHKRLTKAVTYFIARDMIPMHLRSR